MTTWRNGQESSSLSQKVTHGLGMNGNTSVRKSMAYMSHWNEKLMRQCIIFFLMDCHVSWRMTRFHVGNASVQPGVYPLCIVISLHVQRYDRCCWWCVLHTITWAMMYCGACGCVQLHRYPLLPLHNFLRSYLFCACTVNVHVNKICI